ncbi:MAG: response regulator, partial [Hyphomicrobiales bacterium]
MALDLTMSVLIVDDYNTMVKINRSLLRQLGFRDIDEASNGADAYKMIEERQYGLVLSDWNMKPMSGYDLLMKIRENPKISQLPFIMITAEAKTEQVIAAKRAGVNNYIVKPFNVQTLKKKLEHVFGQ